MKNLKLFRWLWASRIGLAFGLAIFGAAMITLLLCSDRACQMAASGRVFHEVASVPAREVGLVLGTSKTTRRGKANLHFNQRIEAAVALYRAGKVRHLLVSGDNHILASYDEGRINMPRRVGRRRRARQRHHL